MEIVLQFVGPGFHPLSDYKINSIFLFEYAAAFKHNLRIFSPMCRNNNKVRQISENFRAHILSSMILSMKLGKELFPAALKWNFPFSLLIIAETLIIMIFV